MSATKEDIPNVGLAKRGQIWCVGSADMRAACSDALGLRHEIMEFPDTDALLAYAEQNVEKGGAASADLLLSSEPLFRGDLPSTVVVSSARDEAFIRSCFERGGLDFFSYPFNRNEFIVKIDRYVEVMRQRRAVEALRLDPLTMTVVHAKGCTESLTSKEFQILTLFREQRFHVSRDDLAVKVWGGREGVNTKTIDIHLLNLRRKLAPIGLSIQRKPPHDYLLMGEQLM